MLTVDFDQVDDVYKASPGWWGIISNQEDIKCQKEDLLFEIQEQYLKLNNLGIDFLGQYEEEMIEYKVLSDMLKTINEKYIPFLDNVRLDYDKLLITAKSIYEILFVDFIKDTIPQICSIKKLNSPSQLIQANSEEIRSFLLEHYNNTLNQLNILYKINPNLAGGMVKNSFAIDLFAGNLESFCEEFMFPVIIKYINQIRENYV